MPSKPLEFSQFKSERFMPIYKEAKKHFKVDTLRNDVKDLQAKLKLYEEKKKKEHENTLVQIQKSENLFIEEEKKSRNLQEENSNLKESLKGKEEECSRLLNLNKDLEDNLKELRAEIKSLKSENVRLSAKKKTVNEGDEPATKTLPSKLQKPYDIEKLRESFMKEVHEKFERDFMEILNKNSSRSNHEEGRDNADMMTMMNVEKATAPVEKEDEGKLNDTEDMEEVDLPPQTPFVPFQEQTLDNDYDSESADLTQPSTQHEHEPEHEPEPQPQPEEENQPSQSVFNEEEFAPLSQMIEQSNALPESKKPTLSITSKNNSGFEYKETNSFDSIFSGKKQSEVNNNNNNKNNNNNNKNYTSKYPQPSIPSTSPRNPRPQPYSNSNSVTTTTTTSTSTSKVPLPESLSNLKYGKFFELIGGIDESKRACYAKFFNYGPYSFGEVFEKIVSPRYGQPFLFYITHPNLGSSSITFTLMELLDFNVFGDTKEDIGEFIDALFLINSECREDVINIVEDWRNNGMSFKKYGYLKEKSVRD